MLTFESDILATEVCSLHSDTESYSNLRILRDLRTQQQHIIRFTTLQALSIRQLLNESKTTLLLYTHANNPSQGFTRTRSTHGEYC